ERVGFDPEEARQVGERDAVQLTQQTPGGGRRQARLRPALRRQRVPPPLAVLAGGPAGARPSPRSRPAPAPRPRSRRWRAPGHASPASGSPGPSPSATRTRPCSTLPFSLGPMVLGYPDSTGHGSVAPAAPTAPSR